MLASALVIAVTVGTNIFVPTELRKTIEQGLKNACSSCKYSIENIEISLASLEITLSNIILSGGSRSSTYVAIKANSIKAQISLPDLLRGNYRFTRIKIINLNAEIIEGDLKIPSSNSSQSKDDISFAIDNIDIIDGQFLYVREHLSKKASIHINKISAHIETIGNTPEFKSKPSTAHLTATLEESGSINLTVSSLLFSKDLFVDIALQIDHQNLARMNPYFKINDGIILTGQLITAQSKVEVRKNILHSFVQAEYEGLNFKYEKNQERTAAVAFFSNLLIAAKLNLKNTRAKPQDQIKYIQLSRDPEKSLISFILVGMKEAALKVATD